MDKWIVVVVKNTIDDDGDIVDTKTYSPGEYDTEDDAITEKKRLEKNAKDITDNYSNTEITVTCERKMKQGFEIPVSDDEDSEDEKNESGKADSDSDCNGCEQSDSETQDNNSSPKATRKRKLSRQE